VSKAVLLIFPAISDIPGKLSSKKLLTSFEIYITRGESCVIRTNILSRPNPGSVRHYNELVDLHEAYAEDSLDLMNELEGFKDFSAQLAQNYRDMVKDIRRNSLCKKFPKTLVPDLKLLDTLVPKIKVNF